MLIIKLYNLSFISNFVADFGEYWRLLTPGYYELVASKDGFIPESKIISIEKTIDQKDIEQNNPTLLEAEIVDFVLTGQSNDVDNNLDYIKY